MTQSEILQFLDTNLRGILEEVRQEFAQQNESVLQKRSSDPKQWNILECFEHLNRTITDYLPQIELSIHRAKAHQKLHRPDEVMTYNWLGKEAMRWATAPSGKRFKTSKRYNPLGKPLPVSTIKAFIINAEKLLRLIQMSKEVDINKAKVRFAPMPVFKYKLGNLLAFLVAHNRRHVDQAKRLLEMYKA